MPWQVKEPPTLEREPNQRGMETWSVLPAMRGTTGVKLMVLLELAPVMRLLLVSAQEFMTEGQNCRVDCPVPSTLLDASLIDTRIFSAAPVPPPQGLVIVNCIRDGLL